MTVHNVKSSHIGVSSNLQNCATNGHRLQTAKLHHVKNTDDILNTPFPLLVLEFRVTGSQSQLYKDNDSVDSILLSDV